MPGFMPYLLHDLMNIATISFLKLRLIMSCQMVQERGLWDDARTISDGVVKSERFVGLRRPQREAVIVLGD